VKIYKHNGLSYDKDKKIYYDEKRAYKIVYEGYVENLKKEYFNYSILSDNGIHYKKITKVFFEKKIKPFFTCKGNQMTAK